MNCRSYQIRKQGEKYILSIEKIKNILLIECITENGSRYFTEYSIEYSPFESIIDAQKELINLIEINTFQINKKEESNSLSIKFGIQENSLLNNLYLELKLDNFVIINENDSDKNKLEKILNDPNKQKYIEVKFIKKLYEIDINNIFIDEFNEILKNCDQSRQKEYDKNTFNILGDLGRCTALIAKEMLQKIYLFDKQKLILKMIRTIFEFNCSENEEKLFLTKYTTNNKGSFG